MFEEKEKIGTDLIKKAIKFLYDFSMEAVDDLKDKKLSFPEIIGFGDNAYTGVTIVLKWKELIVQVKNIDTEEAVDLAQYVGELVKDATGDQVDVIIKNAIEAIEAEIAIYENNIVPIIETIKSLKK